MGNRSTSSLWARPRRPVAAAAVLAAGTLSASFLTAFLPAAPAQAASTACPWVGSSAPIPQRVSEVLAAMTLAQRVDLLTGASGSSYVGFIPAIGSLCIPAMNLEDGPAGVGDGMTGVTQLPAPVDVAATWDTSAEQQYGQLIGGEQAASRRRRGRRSTSGRPSTSCVTRAGAARSSRSARIPT